MRGRRRRGRSVTGMGRRADDGRGGRAVCWEEVDVTHDATTACRYEGDRARRPPGVARIKTLTMRAATYARDTHACVRCGSKPAAPNLPHSPIDSGTLPLQLRTKDPGHDRAYAHHRPCGDDVVCNLLEFIQGEARGTSATAIETRSMRRDALSHVLAIPHLPHLPTYPSTHPLPPFLPSLQLPILHSILGTATPAVRATRP